MKKVEKKRLSLDVFKEKSIGSDVNVNQEGGATTVPCSISLITIAILLSSDSSRCCSSDDCHPQ